MYSHEIIIEAYRKKLGFLPDMDIVDNEVIWRDEVKQPVLGESDFLEILKYLKIKELKNVAENKILSKYPIHKQLNIISLLGYSEENRKQMITYISSVKENVKKLKIDVMSCTNKSEIESIKW